MLPTGLNRFLAIALVFALASWLLLPTSLMPHEATRVLVSWNAGTWAFLLLTANRMLRCPPEEMEVLALKTNLRLGIALPIVLLSAIACIAAVLSQLDTIGGLKGDLRKLHFTLGVSTVVSAWLLTQVIFAIGYAHEYYKTLRDFSIRVLEFPNTPKPDYVDFIYLSFGIGVSGSTADVSFCNKRIRWRGTVHGLVAFVFNTTILGLTVTAITALS